jgi:hypothetical protein
MPITIVNDPPGSRILSKFEGDAVEEEQIREWSPNGAWVKMRQRGSPASDKWQQKNLVDLRMMFRLDDDPPVIP